MRADIVDRVLLIPPDSMKKFNTNVCSYFKRKARTKLLAPVAVRFGRATLAD